MDDGGGLQAAIAEFDAGAAVGDIEPESNAPGVGLPGADGSGTGLDAVTVESRAIVDKEIPGHKALSGKAAPFEIAVGTLPVIAEETGGIGKSAVPAESEASEAGFRSGDGDGGFGARAALCQNSIMAPPAPGAALSVPLNASVVNAAWTFVMPSARA